MRAPIDMVGSFEPLALLSMTRKHLLRIEAKSAMVQAMTTAARRAILIGVMKHKGKAGLGREIGVTGQAISQWVREGIVPPKRVAKLSEITGIPPHEIRPDVFPPPQDAQRT